MARSDRRGFSLVELLVVIAIVGVLVGLGVANAAASKRSEQIVSTLSRLHQCQVAVALYSADQVGEDASFRVPSLWAYTYHTEHGRNFYGVTSETTSTACGQHPESGTVRFVLFENSDLSSPEFERYVARVGDGAVLFSDDNCNPPDVPVRADYVTKLGLAVLRDGSLLRRRHQGKVGSIRFWETNP